MTYLNIIEKFKILFNTVLDFKEIIIFLGQVIVLTTLHVTKKLSLKRYAECTILSLIITLLFSILINKKILFNTFDNFLTIFFKNIYFPSIYVYISMLVIILLSTIVTLINKKTKKAYKIINSSVFTINGVLLILILNIIAKNKIDIFSISSLYTSTPLVAALEISTDLFLVWLGMLLITFVTDHIIESITNKKQRTNEVYIPNLEVNAPSEASIIPAYEPTINIPLTDNNINIPLTINNDIEDDIEVTPINYIPIPLSKENENISFQDILERITTLEKIDGNIDDIDIFDMDEEYNTNEINVLL